MKIEKLFLVFLMAIMIVGCDPEFRHEFKGKVIEENGNNPLKDVKLEYTFFPIENWQHWRSNMTEGETIQFTDENGEFRIVFSTLSTTFDSLRVRMNKEGYKEKTLISNREEWKSGLGINLRMFDLNFGQIKLEKKKTDANKG